MESQENSVTPMAQSIEDQSPENCSASSHPNHEPESANAKGVNDRGWLQATEQRATPSQQHLLTLTGSPVANNNDYHVRSDTPSPPSVRKEGQDINTVGTKTNIIAQDQSSASSKTVMSPSSRARQLAQGYMNSGGDYNQPHSSYKVTLPDITGQPDPEGILQRRLQTYQSFTAPESYMRHVPKIDESLFLNERRPHLRYYIKTVATIKCDLCGQKCRSNSEVYQCRDCTAQICRECVEDKLAKEQFGVPSMPWEWLGPYHAPLKAAYLLRKEAATETHARGEWVGGVEVPGQEGMLHVKLEVKIDQKLGAKKTKATASDQSADSNGSVDENVDGAEFATPGSSKKARKRKSPEEKAGTASDEENRRRLVQNLSVNFKVSRKLDLWREQARIAHTTSPLTSKSGPSTPSSQSLTAPSSVDGAPSDTFQQGHRRASQDSQATIPDPDLDEEPIPAVEEARAPPPPHPQVPNSNTPALHPQAFQQPHPQTQIRMPPTMPGHLTPQQVFRRDYVPPPPYPVPWPAPHSHQQRLYHPTPTQTTAPNNHDSHLAPLTRPLNTIPPPTPEPLYPFFQGRVIVHDNRIKHHHIVGVSINAIDLTTNTRIVLPIRQPPNTNWVRMFGQPREVVDPRRAGETSGPETAGPSARVVEKGKGKGKGKRAREVDDDGERRKGGADAVGVEAERSAKRVELE